MIHLILPVLMNTLFIYFDVYYTRPIISTDWVVDSNNEGCGVFFLLDCVLLINYTNYGAITISQANWSCDGALVLYDYGL